MNVIFVCTGNTCRSPMAEGYLRSLKLPYVEVESRGLSVDGSPVSVNSAAVMTESGIDISTHISKPVSAYDLEWADRIICMSHTHREILKPFCDEARLLVLGDGIPDPFGGDTELYRECRDSIFAAIDALLKDGFFDTISVKPVEREQIKKVAELETVCFSEPWSEETLLDAIAHGTKLFTAVRGKEVLGYIGISTVLDEGYITNVAVFPQYRRQGVGAALIKKVFELASDLSLSFVSLEVRESNEAAIALYTAFGFKVEGKRNNFYTNPKEAALIMTKRF